jgi:hypothetical protein
VRFISSVLGSLLILTLCNASENPKSKPSSPAQAGGNSAQQLVELTPADGGQDGFFGQSVAIAGDTVAVESFSNKNGQGAVYVYVKPASGWKNATLTAELTAVGGSSGWLAAPVVISPDGNTIVVSGIFSGNVYPVVLVYVKPAGGWVNMTQTAELHATHGGVFDFGFSIATDGDDILVGALGCSGNGDFSSGAAYLFVKPAGGWTDMSQTATLEETDPLGCDNFGGAVAIQGNTAVVGRSGGGMTPPVAPGALYVFTKPAGGWVTMGETAKLTGQTNTLGDYLGASVALSGNTILAPLNFTGSPNSGAYIYTEPTGGWVNGTQTATLTNTNKGVTSMGIGIALDGSTAAVIAQYRGGSTRALTLYDEPAGGWQNATTPNVTMIPADEAASDGFGTRAVAISGGIIVVGAQDATRNGNTAEGAAYIFQQN